MIKSVKVFPFSFLKIITINANPLHKYAKWPPSDLTSWTLTLVLREHSHMMSDVFWMFFGYFNTFFCFIKIKPWHKHAKWPPSDFTSWTPTLMFLFDF
jgi:hypothetical protein